MFYKVLAKTALCAVFAFLLSGVVFSQKKGSAKPKPKPASTAGPKVTQIDIEGLRSLLVPKGKPVLINFWATWCDPCREEFPDLVAIDGKYRGKLDVITVSLDDVEDIATAVPKFLREVKAQMPAYLLRTPDESAAITMVAKDWSGSLPMTVILNTKGETAYQKSGKFNTQVLTAEIDKVLAAPTTRADLQILMDFVKIKNGRRDEAMFFYENNWKVYRDEALKAGIIHSYELIDARSEANTGFDIVLVTRYKNERQMAESEKNFEPLLKRLRPNGPVLKNDLKPADFRENVFVYTGKPAFSSRNN